MSASIEIRFSGAEQNGEHWRALAIVHDLRNADRGGPDYSIIVTEDGTQRRREARYESLDDGLRAFAQSVRGRDITSITVSSHREKMDWRGAMFAPAWKTRSRASRACSCSTTPQIDRFQKGRTGIPLWPQRAFS